MKRIISIALTLILSSLAMNAQVITGVPIPGQEPTVTEKTVMNEELWDYRYTELLKVQNKCLSNRKTALIITTSGCGAAFVGSTIGADTEAGAIIFSLGAVAVLTGGIWSVINEFKLIDNQKQLNEHLCLKFTPTSIAITF